MQKVNPHLLRDLKAFSGIELPVLETMLATSKSAFYAKGETFFREGEVAARFFVMLDGFLHVVRTTPAGEQVIMRHFGTGEIFGMAPAIGRDTYPATSVAISDCVALSWPMKYWQEFCEITPQFQKNALSAVGERLQGSQDRIVEMATERVENRVAKALVRLVEQAGKPTPQGTLIDVAVTRQDIAEMTGTTLHTVSRIFSAWSSKGIVEVGRKKIEVLSSSRLSDIAGEQV